MEMTRSSQWHKNRPDSLQLLSWSHLFPSTLVASRRHWSPQSSLEMLTETYPPHCIGGCAPLLLHTGPLPAAWGASKSTTEVERGGAGAAWYLWCPLCACAPASSSDRCSKHADGWANSKEQATCAKSRKLFLFFFSWKPNLQFDFRVLK